MYIIYSLAHNSVLVIKSYIQKIFIHINILKRTCELSHVPFLDIYNNMNYEIKILVSCKMKLNT